MYDIEIKDLEFAYPDEPGTPVLSGVDYTIEKGDFVCLLGQSGCGKSTLLRLIAGLEKSDPEQLLVNGEPVTAPSLNRVMVFQDYGLFPWMSAGENICIALKQKFKDWDKTLISRATTWCSWASSSPPSCWCWSWSSSTSSRNAPCTGP